MKRAAGSNDEDFMRVALRLARRGYGLTSPNPMVGAVLVHRSNIIATGWHSRAGLPHAEIVALHSARRKQAALARRPFPWRETTLYVTLEPCCTHGRTPPCTDAVVKAGIGRVVIAATDPNPAHAGRGLRLLRRAGIEVIHGVLGEEATQLNEAFNHWIVHRTPFITIKAAMTLDGKIATANGQSKWITGEAARAQGMRLRLGADAILVGINTVMADDPKLTFRPGQRRPMARSSGRQEKQLRRVILDSMARTPLDARLVADAQPELTTVVVSRQAPGARVKALSKKVRVLVAPTHKGRIDLNWLLEQLGAENVSSLLVEGGGEVNAAFLENKLAHRIAFFYAPLILGGRDSIKAVGGTGAQNLDESIALNEVTWKRFGQDWLLTARVKP